MTTSYRPPTEPPRHRWRYLIPEIFEKRAEFREEDVVRDDHGRFAEKFGTGLKTTMTLAAGDIILDAGFGKATILDINAYTRTKPLEEQKIVVELEDGSHSSIIAKPEQKWHVLTVARQRALKHPKPPKLSPIATTADKNRTRQAVSKGQSFIDDLETKAYEAVDEYGGADDEALKRHVMEAVTKRWIGEAPEDIQPGMRVRFVNPHTAHELEGTVVHVGEALSRGHGPSWALGMEGADAPIIRVRPDTDAVTGKPVSGEDGGIIGVKTVSSLEPVDPDVQEVVDQVTKVFNDDVYWPYGQGNNIKAITAHLISMWAASSSDTNVLSVMLQEAISEEFGIPETDFIKDAFMTSGPPPVPDGLVYSQISDQEYARHRKNYKALEANPSFKAGLRKFVRAQYEETQEWLASIGIDEMMVYRGFDWGQSARPDWIPDGKAIVAADMNPASSFSADFGTARSFAGGGAWYRRGSGGGSMGAAIVPRDRIFAVPGSGIGAYSEQEVVVLGGKDQELFMWTWGRREGDDVDEYEEEIQGTDDMPSDEEQVIENMRTQIDPVLKERTGIEDKIRQYFTAISGGSPSRYYAIETFKDRLEVSKQDFNMGGDVKLSDQAAKDLEVDLRSAYGGEANEWLPNDVMVQLLDGKLVFFWPERMNPDINLYRTYPQVSNLVTEVARSERGSTLTEESPHTGEVTWTLRLPSALRPGETTADRMHAMNKIRTRLMDVPGLDLSALGGGLDGYRITMRL